VKDGFSNSKTFGRHLIVILLTLYCYLHDQTIVIYACIFVFHKMSGLSEIE